MRDLQVLESQQLAELTLPQIAQELQLPLELVTLVALVLLCMVEELELKVYKHSKIYNSVHARITKPHKMHFSLHLLAALPETGWETAVVTDGIAGAAAAA